VDEEAIARAGLQYQRIQIIIIIIISSSSSGGSSSGSSDYSSSSSSICLLCSPVIGHLDVDAAHY
jgi:hypothetical protein